MDCEFITFTENEVKLDVVNYKNLELIFLTQNGFVNVASICEQMGIPLNKADKLTDRLIENKHLGEKITNVFYCPTTFPLDGPYCHPYITKLLLHSLNKKNMAKNFLYMMKQYAIRTAVKEHTFRPISKVSQKSRKI
jgi:hypothetical protein